MDWLSFAWQHIVKQAAEIADDHGGSLVLQGIEKLIVGGHGRAVGHPKVEAGDPGFFIAHNGGVAVVEFAGADGENIDGIVGRPGIEDVLGIQIILYRPAVVEHALCRRKAQAEQQHKGHDPNDIFFHEKTLLTQKPW